MKNHETDHNTELNQESLNYIEDIARLPMSMSGDELLKTLSQSITTTMKGKTKNVDWSSGIDHTKEIAEIALQFIDVIVYHNVQDAKDTKVNHDLWRQTPCKHEEYNIKTLVASINNVLAEIYKDDDKQ